MEMATSCRGPRGFGFRVLGLGFRVYSERLAPQGSSLVWCSPEEELFRDFSSLSLNPNCFQLNIQARLSTHK